MQLILIIYNWKDTINWKKQKQCWKENKTWKICIKQFSKSCYESSLLLTLTFSLKVPNNSYNLVNDSNYGPSIISIVRYDFIENELMFTYTYGMFFALASFLSFFFFQFIMTQLFFLLNYFCVKLLKEVIKMRYNN